LEPSLGNEGSAVDQEHAPRGGDETHAEEFGIFAEPGERAQTRQHESQHLCAHRAASVAYLLDESPGRAFRLGGSEPEALLWVVIGTSFDIGVEEREQVSGLLTPTWHPHVNLAHGAVAVASEELAHACVLCRGRHALRRQSPR